MKFCKNGNSKREDCEIRKFTKPAQIEVVKHISPCACLPPLTKVSPFPLSSICKPPELPRLLLLPPKELLPRPPMVGGLGGRGDAGPLPVFFRKLNLSTIPSLSGWPSLLLKPLITLRISITSDFQYIGWFPRSKSHKTFCHIGLLKPECMAGPARPPGAGPQLTAERRHRLHRWRKGSGPATKSHTEGGMPTGTLRLLRH